MFKWIGDQKVSNYGFEMCFGFLILCRFCYGFYGVHGSWIPYDLALLVKLETSNTANHHQLTQQSTTNNQKNYNLLEKT